MPFTFSHPAIVIPLKYLSKRWVSMTGLVIGTMIPDFEYFIRMKVESKYSHTWSGLFWFDLPLGMLLLIIYQALIKDKLINHLPTELNQRLSRFIGNQGNYSLQYFVVVVFSILAGASSHILWDGFTHPGGYFVLHISFLSDSFNIAGYHLYIYKVLQHSSTIIGAIAIATVCYQMPKGPVTKVPQINSFWQKAIFIMFIVVAIRLATGQTYSKYGDLIVSLIAAGLLGLLISSILSRKSTVA